VTEASEDRESLRPGEIDLLREMLGRPESARVSAAIDRVERQVAWEDLILLMVGGATNAARMFFDIVLELGTEAWTPKESETRRGEES
jgi:hypothetical protein